MKNIYDMYDFFDLLSDIDLFEIVLHVAKDSHESALELHDKIIECAAILQ